MFDTKPLALGEMLGLLALVAAMVALVASPAEGLVLTKCELKAELEAMLPDMDDDTMKVPLKMENILAKSECSLLYYFSFFKKEKIVVKNVMKKVLFLCFKCFLLIKTE